MGGPEVLDQQISYLQALRTEVKRLVEAQKSAAEVKAAVETLRTTLREKPNIAQYLGNMFPSQVEKVFVEMGGKPFETANTPEGRYVPVTDQEVVLIRAVDHP